MTYVVSNGADAATCITAITVEVDAAAAGRAVVGVDVVEWGAELSRGRVPEGICPGRDRCHV